MFMFCPECGKKNEEGVNFCEYCGAKIQEPKKVKTPKKDKKPLKKSTKILIAVISVIVIAIVIFFIICSSKYDPKAVAEGYFLAAAEKDADKLYQYMDVENSDFTSKKVFKKLIETDEKTELVNYSVGTVQKSSDGLSATVPITYTLKGESSSSTTSVHLVKDKQKKLLFFDNWQVSSDDSMITTDYQITTFKDSTVTLEGVNVDKKYLDKKESTDDYDVYVLPTVFEATYDVTVTLKNGIELKDEINIGSYGDSNLTNLEVSDATKDAIEKIAPQTIESLYKSAMEKKAFADIKKDYEYEGADLSDLEDSYDLFMNSISEDGLTKFTVSKASVDSATITEDGYLRATIDIEYEYNVKRTFLGEERENTDTTEDTVYLTFDYSKDNYKLVDFYSLDTYFSVF